MSRDWPTGPQQTGSFGGRPEVKDTGTCNQPFRPNYQSTEQQMLARLEIASALDAVRNPPQPIQMPRRLP